MLKYMLRYVPLLILALLLLPLVIASALDAKNTLFSSFDGNVPIPYSALYSVVVLPSGEAWAVGGSFNIRNGYSEGQNGPLVPAGGRIFRYSHELWNEVNASKPLSWPLRAVSFDAPDDGWAVGDNGVRVHWDGRQWSVVLPPASMNKTLRAVSMLSPSDGWAAGYSGTILHYDGAQWQSVPSQTSLDLYSIAMASPTEGWAVGDSGVMLHYRNGMWSALNPLPTNNALHSVIMQSANEGWATGDNGTILHYRDGVWARVEPVEAYKTPAAYQSVTFSSIAMNALRSGWIVANQHLLTYSQEAWITQVNVIPWFNGKLPDVSINNFSLYGIAATASGEAWAVGKTSGDITGTGRPPDLDEIAILHCLKGKWTVFAILK